MKVTYALASVSRSAGGVFEICRRLAQTVGPPQNVAVLGLADEFTDADLPAWLPLRPEVFSTLGPGSFGFAPGYAEGLEGFNPDLVHVHGLWTYPSLAAYRWSRKSKRPVVYSAHGMLDPWAVRNSGWKKRVVRRLYEDAAHGNAACFHVNSEAEYRAVRAYGLRNPVCIIANGIDLPESHLTSNSEFQVPNLNGRKVLLYLGRLHPKKNLVSLLQAWALVGRDNKAARDWLLVIAGWDQNDYEAELRRVASDLDLLPSVHFAGPLFGEQKAAACRNATAFVLPSLSEGLPVAVLEAWAFAKPVLMTDACNLPEGFKAGAALRTGTSADDIAAGLRQLLETDESDLTAMGARGRALAQEEFSWPEIGAEMRRVCEWVVNGGHAPASVRFD